MLSTLNFCALYYSRCLLWLWNARAPFVFNFHLRDFLILQKDRWVSQTTGWTSERSTVNWGGSRSQLLQCTRTLFQCSDTVTAHHRCTLCDAVRLMDCALDPTGHCPHPTSYDHFSTLWCLTLYKSYIFWFFRVWDMFVERTNYL